MSTLPSVPRAALPLPALLRLACAFAVATNGTLLMPLIVAMLMRRFGVGEDAATGIGGLEILGIAAACAVFPRWIARRARFFAALGLAGTVLAQAAGAWLPSLAAVGGARAAAGLFEGMLFVVVAAGLSNRAAAERAWGVIVLVGGVIDGLLLVLAAVLPTAWVDAWLFVLFAAAFALIAAPSLSAARYAESGTGPASAERRPQHRLRRLMPVWGVMVLVYGVLAAQWAIADVVGHRAGIPPATSGVLLSLASVAGLAGCLAASHPRSHALRLPIVWMGQALLAVSVAWFFMIRGWPDYFASQLLVTLAFYVVTPFLTARLSELDSDGSLVARSIVITFASAGAGTAAAGAMLARLGNLGCAATLAACALLAMPFAWAALAPAPREPRPLAAPSPEAS